MDLTPAAMDAAAPAAQGLRSGGKARTWDFAFATGIECSTPRIIDQHGRSVRRDLLEECGHYRHWRRDLELVKELGTPVLRYGLPNHLILFQPFRNGGLEGIKFAGALSYGGGLRHGDISGWCASPCGDGVRSCGSASVRTSTDDAGR